MVSARRSQTKASAAAAPENPPAQSADKVEEESSSTKEEYATPARAEEGMDSKRAELSHESESATPPAIQVTPPDTVEQQKTTGDSEGNKHVRFGGAVPLKSTASAETVLPPEVSAATDDSPNKRGLVSRRGRYVSPGRRSETTTATVSSPPRKEASTEGQEEAVLEYKTFRSPTRKREDEVPSLCSTGSEFEKEKGADKRAPTSSISCDPAFTETASPLASTDSHDEAKSKKATAAELKDALIMSPPPAKKIDKKTPMRGTVGKLPTLDDPKSPRNFLSPNPPTPSHRLSIETASSFEEKKRDTEEEQETKPSPRRDRERYVATPTDFSNDYGKGHHMSSSFDTSHVLAWLHSPTANGLFSPGGFGSLANTPGGIAPRTPRTPTVSTSFFFSDVASLPRGDNLTPKGEQASASKRKGISNIICISPLASSKARNGASTATTPLNLKDVFSSPVEKSRVRSMPELNDTPSKGRPRVPERSGSKDPSLDADLAEREIMEDEDLSVLLQLASNTPKSLGTGAAGGPVFRSPAAKDGEKEGENGEKLGGLQIPMIGGRDGDKAPKLSRKSQSRDTADADAFAPPQLGMRSSSSNGSKEIYVGGKGKDGKDKSSDKSDKDSKKRKASVNPYAMAHHPYQDMGYYGMPSAMPPAGMNGPSGSMRVVVGGPPPRKSSTGSPSRSPHPPPHHYEYPPNGMPYPPPPPGMYPQYPPGPPPMGYPYPPYPPPPRHLPLYAGAQNGPKSSSSSIKKARPSKVKSSTTSGNKRGSPLLESKTPGSSKKPKKAATPGSQKKKVKSPPVADKAKAANAVHQVNEASGGKNDKAAALAAAILRGVTMRPSGKWQAQLYFAGKSRYIGVFDTREKAALAYEIAREKLKSGPTDGTGKSTENLVNAARKAAFEGVNERSAANAASEEAS